MARDEGVYEGSIRGKPCYYVFFSGGQIEIAFYKSPLRYVWAMSLFNDPGMEGYNGRELQQFREDYPGLYEDAKDMIAAYSKKKKAPRKPVVKTGRKYRVEGDLCLVRPIPHRGPLMDGIPSRTV